MDQTKLYKKQISFTEWFENIGHSKSLEMREEDNEKRERMEVVSEIIPFPFDKPVKFMATDITEDSPEFTRYLEEHGEDLCALRLVPTDPSLPKLRMRGHSVRDVLTWFAEQNVDPTKYRANFVPHSENYGWSTIFLVTEKGIFGEIIKGGHYQLSQGFYSEDKPIIFSFDFSNWKLIPDNPNALSHLQGIVSHLNVEDETKREKLKESVDATFSNNYISGYFETVSSEEYGLWFVDYNRVLGKMYGNFVPTMKEPNENLSGNTAFTGNVKGIVRIVNQENIHSTEFKQGDILVTKMTTPDFVVLMQKAGGIVTDLGGILSHAAIVARELKTPCIVGTENATSLLKDGDLVEVDAVNGVVKKL